MEFADEALLAKMEGNDQASTAFFEKAFELEKEAALSVDESDKEEVSDARYILIRSAATLAVNCGQWQEAEQLITIGLSGNPPAFIVEELSDLETRLKQLIREQGDYFEIVGIITSADADNSEIKIQEVKSRNIYIISVPTNQINDIVRSYWADLVQIKGQKMASGSIVLSKISKAA